MKILVVCQYYYPENFQINDICQDLVARGHAVTVLTGLPNYPDGVIPPEYRHGKRRDENINGVHVIRCFEIGRAGGAIRLALNYFSFCLSGWWRVGRLERDFDLVFVYQLSPVLMAVPAIRYKKKYKVPMVLYCNDIWPESVKMMLHSDKSVAFKIVKRISRKIYRECTRLIVQTEYFLPYFANVHGISPKKMVVVPQFAKTEYLECDFNNNNGVVDFVFLGNVGVAQNLSVLIEAVQKIRNIPGFAVHIVGDGRCLAELKSMVSQMKLENIIRFYGRRPVEEMPDFYRMADVCVVSLNNDNLTGLTLPGKVQGYMAAGKMILGIINGAAKEVIGKCGCGVCVEPDDVDELAECMAKLILEPCDFNSYGERGREYFKLHYTPRKYIDSLEDVFDQVLNSQTEPARHV